MLCDMNASSSSQSTSQSAAQTAQSEHRNLQKRPRYATPDPAGPRARHESKSCHDNTAIRVALRSLTYVIYDGVSSTSDSKQFARIGKVLVELLIDERLPPPHRADMKLRRKCAEFLAAPAASSLVWYVIAKWQSSHARRIAGKLDAPNALVLSNAIWTVLHRTARHALIYRLFFRIGSLRYSLASALGIVCCFFKESLFRDLLRFQQWPRHFSPSQGFAAILRSIVYAASFALPLHRLSVALQRSPRRRGNIKKLIFAILLSQAHRFAYLQRLVASNTSWQV